MKSISIYLHVPFCVHRCGYCDFNTYAGLESLIPDYTNALCQEIVWAKGELGQPAPVDTIFFGGGTPSLLSASHYRLIFESLHKVFSISPDAEISLEANPGTVTLEYLRGLKDIGFNRISFGMQTANPDELRLLERQHQFVDVIRAVSWARKARFDNLNLDLIFGLPGQSLETWKKSLYSALSLNPEHLAIYALSIEQGTPFEKWNQRGMLDLIDQDLAAEMYEVASAVLENNGYTQYEISNWAKHPGNSPLQATDNPLLACKHNLQYWHNLPYLGFGAGAHGFANGIRTANVRSPRAYIQRLVDPRKNSSAKTENYFPCTPATITSQSIDIDIGIGETLMMGLRLTREGVSERLVQERFNQSLQDKFRSEINRLERLGLIEWVQSESAHLRLSKNGRLLGNQVFLEFI